MTLWYRTGTVSVTQSATAVTGVGTLWTNQVAAGDSITFDGGGKWYEISAVASDTSLTLATAFLEATVSGGAYAIKRDGPYRTLQSTLYKRLSDTIDALNRGHTMTSTSSVSIGTGSKTLTVESGVPIQSGARIVVASRANLANAMYGIVTNYTGTALVVNVTNISGSGTFSDWNINIAGGVTQGPAGELTRSGAVTAGHVARWTSNTQVESAGFAATDIAQLSQSNTFAQAATFSASARFNGTIGVGRAGAAAGGIYFNRDPDNPFLLFSAGPSATPTDIGQFRASLASGVIGITNASGGLWGVAYNPTTNRVGIGNETSPSTTLHVNGPIRCGSYTVATLPSAATVGAGTRAHVTDATATTFASTVAGGGTNKVPVYSDGSAWKIG